MRYTYLQTMEKKVKEITEDRGSRKDKFQRMALLARQRDISILKEKYNFNILDSNYSIYISFNGFERCVISGEILNTIVFKHTPSKIEMEFYNGENSPEVSITNSSSKGLDANIALYPNKNIYTNDVVTVAILISVSEDDNTLCIEYRDINPNYELVKSIVDDGIFEPNDVFEINTLDGYDSMYIYDIRTGRLMSNVYVSGNWIKSIFDKEDK